MAERRPVYLEGDHEVEEEDHVDDPVDDSLLDGHHQVEHDAHDDPVLTQQVPDPPT